MEKDKVDMELIRRYVRGELTPREMYAVERQAQANPMLMDIILGMEQEMPDVHSDNLADIRRRIAKRTGRRQTAARRLTPAQRWTVAASILAVLTMGTWWFTRQEAVEQREATIAAAPEEAPRETAPETQSVPEPVPPIAKPEASVSERKETKDERIAVAATPKAYADAGTPDSGEAARIVAAEPDTSGRVSEQVLAAHADGMGFQGMSARQQTARPLAAAKERVEKRGEPTPENGWDAYRQYLKDAMKLAPDEKGKIDLTFTVDDDGRPTEITVAATTNEQLNAFAVLIVRDGPRWLPGTNDERKVTLQLTF